VPPGLSASAPGAVPGPTGTALPVCCRVATCHSRALPSGLTAETSLPSGLNAAGPAAFSGPPIRCLVAADHSCRPSAAGAVGHRGHHARPGGQDAAQRLGRRLEQAVPRLRGRRDPPRGPGQQRRGGRVGGLQGRALRGQPDRQARGALLAGTVPGRPGGEPGPGERGQDQQDQGPGERPPPPLAPGGGPAAGPQEFGLGRGQRRVAARVRGPDARGLAGRGELDAAVQPRGVPAVPPPARGVLGQLAVQDQAGLILLQPVPQPRPRLQQDVVRDLRAAR
jgi:hypothetical protein